MAEEKSRSGIGIEKAVKCLAGELARGLARAEIGAESGMMARGLAMDLTMEMS